MCPVYASPNHCGTTFRERCGWTKPFFSGLHTLPQGGGCLPAFLEILGALSGITLPPPPGGGRPRVGWPFLGKIFVSKIFNLPLSSRLSDLVSTLAVLHDICSPEVAGSNPGTVVTSAPVPDGCASLRFCEGIDSK